MQAGLVTKKYRVMAAGLLIMAQFTPKDNPNNIICDNPIEETYDFIIAGGGTAGSVLAARLSEDLSAHVLLLESGVTGTGFTEWPALTRFVYDTKKWDWRFKNVRDEGYCFGMKDKVCKLSRGRMLGGQSAFNRMMYVRGNRNDYDLWEKLGNPGWGYGDVLPYFIRSEDNLDHRLRHSPYHGVGGPLKVSSPARHQLSNLAPLWLKAAVHNKFEIGDINGDKQSRFMLHQTTTAYGERWSTARAFLAPASHRHNLDILTEAHVTRVIVDPDTKRAKGVVFYVNKKRYVAWARKEVIVSAGTFNSPQLLKLSGIGPCGELKKHGIFCKKDLPGVGENLQSHFGIGGIDFLVSRDGMKGPSKNLKNPVYKKQYINKRIGPLASVMGLEGTGFISSSYNNVSYGQDWPDIQLLFFSQHTSTDGYYEALIYGLSYKLWQTFYPNKFKPGFRIVPVNLRPRSRGRVALRSRNPWQHPDIFLNLFDDPHDLAILREGGQKAEAMGLSLPFIRAGAAAMGEKNRFCYIHPTGGPDWWDCRARVFPETLYQETSTCKMGPPSDPLAVVDNQLRVYGVSGLRVVDASIMPNIVSGDATAATVMIAERAADMIRAFWHGVELDNKDPAAFVEETVMNLGGDETSSATGLDLQLAGLDLDETFSDGQEELFLEGQVPFDDESLIEGLQTTGEEAELPFATQGTDEAEVAATEETMQGSSMPETTAATFTKEVQETVATQQPTEATSESVPETTVTATETPQQSFTLTMGKVSPMGGTIMVEPVAPTVATDAPTVAPTAEAAEVTDAEPDETEPENDSENADLGDYGALPEAELFDDFPGAGPGNFGGFLGPIRDYSGYSGQVTILEEEDEGVAEPEPIAAGEIDALLEDRPDLEFDPSLELDPVPGYETPFESDQVSEFDTAFENNAEGFDALREAEFGAPLGFSPVPDYGAPFGSDPAAEFTRALETDTDGYGAPRESDVVSDYGAPLGTDPAYDYGSSTQDETTSEYKPVSKAGAPSDFGGYGDYSIRSTVAATAAPSPTVAATETTTVEKPAAGAGRLRDNIKRLKAEMEKALDHPTSAPEVIVTERPTPRFDARAGTTGEPRTYTSLYTSGLGDGMEDAFGGYRRSELGRSGRKREVVDDFMAEASVDHATVFQRGSEKTEKIPSEAETSERSKTAKPESGRDGVENRRQIMQARGQAVTASNRKITTQRTVEKETSHSTELEHTTTKTRTSALSTPRGNVRGERKYSGRGSHSSASSEQTRPVSSRLRKAKTATSDRPASQSRRRNSAAGTGSNRSRTRTWNISIVTRTPKVKADRGVSQRRRTGSHNRSSVSSKRYTSSRQPTSTVRSRLLRKEEPQDNIAAFGSRRMYPVRIETGSVSNVSANDKHHTRNSKPAERKAGGKDEDDEEDKDEDWSQTHGDAAALDPSTWGMKTDDPL